MTRRSKTIAVTCGGVVLLSCAAWLATRRLDGPWGMVPGGAFSQQAEACGPASWERFADVREVELEVSPERPRSMTTWSVVHDGRLFIPADFLTPWKRWPARVLADARVRLRVGDRVFACRADRVSEPALVEELRRTIAAKYEIDPEGRAGRVEVWWFRLGPR